MASIVKMPQLGLTMEEGLIVSWNKKEGDAVAVGDLLMEVETDKLKSEILSEFEGTLLKIIAPAGSEIRVQGILAYIGKPGEKIEDAAVSAPAPSTAPVAAASAPTVPVQAVKAAPGGRIKISPLAKKTAVKMGVDYAHLAGSGPGGRIVQKDILAAPKSAAAGAAPGAAPLGIEIMAGDEVVKLSGIRKTVAQRMTASSSEIPAVTTISKVDVTRLLDLRKKLSEDMDKKYSVNDFMLKAVAKALQTNRRVLVSWNGGSIIQRAHVNLGMAVALDEGLIVPVIKDADKLGLDALANTAKDLAARARDGELTADEYSGSTFTISNMGMMGMESFTPIINQPNAAILGVCAIQDELDMDAANNVFKKKVMRLCLTWDHRLMDGSDAANFQKTLTDLIENPMSILL